MPLKGDVDDRTLAAETLHPTFTHTPSYNTFGRDEPQSLPDHQNAEMIGHGSQVVAYKYTHTGIAQTLAAKVKPKAAHSPADKYICIEAKISQALDHVRLSIFLMLMKSLTQTITKSDQDH